MAQISLLWGFGISSVNLSMLISKKHQRYANSAMAKMTVLTNYLSGGTGPCTRGSRRRISSTPSSRRCNKRHVRPNWTGLSAATRSTGEERGMGLTCRRCDCRWWTPPRWTGSSCQDQEIFQL